ncbi:hypothetical protein [Flavobacterium sp. 316]|uniref:hypothetical protein n=1 Tax=Flavobacterium sp. 316 TaxID=1603293 RepID=UPI000B29EBD1|nr:hypothetical protein [Flavobacterium sp. 316]
MLKSILELTEVKKLERKELRTVQGGKKMCIDPATGLCTQYGLICAERVCQLPPL